MKKILIGLAMISAHFTAFADEGKAVFEANCAACHQMDGAGALGLAPPLAGTLGKRMAFPQGRQYISSIVISGLAGKLESKGVVYQGIMPSWQQFSDEQLASVLNYVLSTFNAADLPADHLRIEAGEIAAARSKKLSGTELRALRAASQ